MLWSQPHGDGSESTTRLMLGRRCLQIGPDILKSVCSVVGHFLLSVELSFQLGNMKRCLDAVADGLQPIKTRQEKTALKKSLSWAKETSSIRIWCK